MASDDQKVSSPKFCAVDDDIILPAILVEDTTVEKRLETVRDTEYRVGDVLICTFLKCGTHWLGNLIHRLLKKPNENADFFPVLVEAVPNHVLEQRPSPRLYASHLRSGRIPREHTLKRGKIVLCLRNPKDVAVSFYHHANRAVALDFKQPWDEFLPLYRAGQLPYKSYLDYVLDWEEFASKNKETVLVVYYEDLQTDGVANLSKIAEHIGVQKSDDALRAILAECAIGNLRDAANKPKAVDLPKAILNGAYDKDGKSVIYRKGTIGDWKNHFTVAQNESYDIQIQEKLGKCSFQFTYEL